MRETWYVMEDGTTGNPREISAGADGVLRHKDGRAVAYAQHGPRTRGVDVGAAPPKQSAEPPADPAASGSTSRDLTADADKQAGDDREMKPAPGGRGYRTRAPKAD